MVHDISLTCKRPQDLTQLLAFRERKKRGHCLQHLSDNRNLSHSARIKELVEALTTLNMWWLAVQFEAMA